MKTFINIDGVECCAACARSVTDRSVSNDLYAAATRALGYFKRNAAGAYISMHEDLAIGQQLSAALAAYDHELVSK
jgi:hypothetical protein